MLWTACGHQYSFGNNGVDEQCLLSNNLTKRQHACISHCTFCILHYILRLVNAYDMMHDACCILQNFLFRPEQCCRVRKQTELEKRKAAVFKLVGLMTSMFRRRHFYEVLPLDPVAWPLLLAAHRDELRSTMAEQAALHHVDASTMPPPASQVTQPSHVKMHHCHIPGLIAMNATGNGECSTQDDRHAGVPPSTLNFKFAASPERKGYLPHRGIVKVAANGETNSTVDLLVQDGGEEAPHMSLLQALLCGAMHSRAAYGYAMAAGHLSSLLNFALLQTVGSLYVISLRSTKTTF